jgi:hypothetical protein
MKKKLGRHPPRFKTDLAVKFRLANSTMEYNLGRLVNLSSGGVCLWTKSKLIAGEKLEMVVESVDKKGLKRRRLLRAKVTWVKGLEAGLMFEATRPVSPAYGRGPAKK